MLPMCIKYIMWGQRKLTYFVFSCNEKPNIRFPFGLTSFNMQMNEELKIMNIFFAVYNSSSHKKSINYHDWNINHNCLLLQVRRVSKKRALEKADTKNIGMRGSQTCNKNGTELFYLAYVAFLQAVSTLAFE